MAFSIGDIFNDVKSSYSSVTDFFSELSGADLFGGNDSSEDSSPNKDKNAPIGVMGMDEDLTDLSQSDTMKFLEHLNTATTKQRRSIRQSKLDDRPSSVSYKDTEAMWMQRLHSIASGQVFTMESK
jgi:hypothetical protein